MDYLAHVRILVTTRKKLGQTRGMWKTEKNRKREMCIGRKKMMWKSNKKRKRERFMRRTNMTWKRERKRKKCMTRTKIMWNREINMDTKLKRVGI